MSSVSLHKEVCPKCGKEQMIERYGIDKMENLRLTIDYEPQFNSYIIRVNY